MRMTTLLAAAALTLAGASAANAGIAMSFADPIPGRQLHSQENGAGAGVALLTYDQNAVISFLFDASEMGAGQTVFANARMEMNLALGAATTNLGVTTAPVTGSFTIYDMSSASRVDIITGTAQLGSYVRIGNTNSLLFSDPDFEYTAGPALAGILPSGSVFADPTEGVFTLTAITPTSFMNPNGTFKTFDANASFTGNAEVVPAPGALALAGLGTLTLIRRKRR